MDQTNIFSELLILGQIALAMLLSGVVGFEREVKDHPAGLRTHMLVGGAAALFVILGNLLTHNLLETLSPDVVEADPVRIIQAVVVGIGFLGAGTILRKRSEEEVTGLTTAASILFVAGIGVTVAVSRYILAIGVTLLALIVLHVIHRFEKRLGL
jgi:putative Mg2+ transporter-C (MgtC) family protein